jgi:hypothetical protein
MIKSAKPICCGLRRCRLGGLVYIALFVIACGVKVEAANWSRFVFEATGTSKSAKNAVQVSEDVMHLTGRGPALREAAEREARRLGGQAGGRTALRQVITASLRAQGADASTLRFVDELAGADLETAAVIMRGGRRLKEAVPDLMTRARLTRQGGTPALGALGLADSVPVDDFVKLDALVAVGKVPAEVAGKPALARLGELLSDATERSSKFYLRYIRGNEGKWAAGGALAWWMADPDSFQDAAGNLTEAGYKKLTELGGEVLASGLRGIGEGSQGAATKMVSTLAESYLKGPFSWAAWLGLALVTYLIGLALPVTRRLFLKPLRRLFRPHA